MSQTLLIIFAVAVCLVAITYQVKTIRKNPSGFRITVSVIGGQSWKKFDTWLLVEIIEKGVGLGFAVFAIANLILFVLFTQWFFDPKILGSPMIIALIYSTFVLWDRIYVFANTKSREVR